VKVKLLDAEFPDGDFVANGKTLRRWSPAVAREVAHEAMCLAQGAQRAAVLLGVDGSGERRDVVEQPHAITS
jgi:hypothetical protein